MAQAAEFFVIDQFVNRRLVAAQRTVGIAPQLERIDLHRQCVEAEQAADQAFSFAEDKLNGFQRLDNPDQPG